LIVHLSGCGKGCAYPWPAPLVVVGDAEGLGIVLDGVAGDAPTSRVADPGLLGHTLSRLAADLRTNKAHP
jgi:precorrin-3B synthase